MDPFSSGHSTRNYSERPLTESSLLALLRAAMAAPSAGDERPWHFVIIRDSRLRKGIAAALPEADMILRAPVAILTCGDKTLQKHVGFWSLDCAAATQNILVEAERQGLGGIWLGVYPVVGRVHRFRDLLQIPEHIVPFALVVLGHSAESKRSEERFDPARVHYDGW